MHCVQTPVAIHTEPCGKVLISQDVWVPQKVENKAKVTLGMKLAQK